jgi:large subunit ribosomal protein L3
MIGLIIGKKGIQKQGFDEQKIRRVYTEVNVSPCYVIDIKTKKEDGYTAIKIGTQTKKTKSIKKPILGQAKKAGIENPLNFIQEVRIKKDQDVEIYEENGKKGLKLGDLKYFIGMKILPSSVFKIGDVVQATGVTKGKGFQGVVKRYGFAGGPKTHGQSDRLRAPGSIGQGTTPGRVWKGKKMPGRMGSDTKTIKGLKVAEVGENSLTVTGVLPGYANNVLLIRTEVR